MVTMRVTTKNESERRDELMGKLYFAYGSNLNLTQMANRCPQAKQLGSAYLPNWRLVFRGVADIEGTGSLELDQLNTKIANLAETIDANKSGFETFMKQFDTDEAKGISANINKMAKGLEAAAAGLKPAESATAQITKATDSTIKLAGEAATVFKETDAALKAMQRQITQLRIEIEQTEQELQGE